VAASPGGRVVIVWNGLHRCPAGVAAAVAIGNFDGVHVGHREILRRTVESARAAAAKAVLVTFEPHPAEVLAPGGRPRLLQTRRQKHAALAETGVDAVLVLAFDLALAAVPASEFVDRLRGALPLVSVHVGAGFRFGAGRDGDVALLRRLGERHGFAVDEVPPVERRGARVSSSRIREAVAAGDVALARELLGRPYAVEGTVVRGEGRGGRLEFPTANLEVDNELLPARGVYVTEADVLGASRPSVTNVGVRPTFDGSRVVVESHLLDFTGDLYGERAEVRLLARLRDERRFASAAELAEQIGRDRAAAAAWFAGAARP
jgi:riboflavin kinase/FMN adenylyltransferase